MEPEQISNAALKQITALAERQLREEKRIAEIEEELKEAKRQHRVTSEEDLPLAMQEVGMTEFKLESGRKITIKADVYASVSSKQMPAVVEWFIEHDLGDLVKTSVTTQFGRGEIEKAKELIKDLMGKDLAPSFEQSVHTGTLKAWLREQLSEGKDVPLDLFGAREVSKSVIK